jgi:hypothetical protein
MVVEESIDRKVISPLKDIHQSRFRVIASMLQQVFPWFVFKFLVNPKI